MALGTYNDKDIRAVGGTDDELLNKYKAEWNAANAAGDQAGMDAAHAAAEKVRSYYGYSGGADGSDFIRFNDPAVAGANGNYAAGGNSSVYASSSGGNGTDLSEYLRRQYAAQLQSDLAGLGDAYNASMTSYDAKAALIPRQYEAQRNNVAAQDAIARRNFDERAAANGLNTGTAGQADLARSAAYTGDIARLNREQQAAMNDIEMQKARLQSEYQTAIQQATAGNAADREAALYNEMLRLQGLQREDAEIAREQERYEAELAADEAKRAQNLALQYGLVTPAGLSSIRSLADLANLSAPVAAVAASSGGGGGGGRRSPGSASAQTRTSGYNYSLGLSPQDKSPLLYTAAESYRPNAVENSPLAYMSSRSGGNADEAAEIVAEIMEKDGRSVAFNALEDMAGDLNYKDYQRIYSAYFK